MRAKTTSYGAHKLRILKITVDLGEDDPRVLEMINMR
jgi:hypothetical protein